MTWPSWLGRSTGWRTGSKRRPANSSVLAGGGAGELTGGRHIRYSSETNGAGAYSSAEGGTPLANLHLTVLEKLGMRMEAIHDSTGRLAL